jgi:Domain of unknown function (DUF4129)
MDRRTLRQWMPLIAVAGLLAIGALAAARSTVQLTEVLPKPDIQPELDQPLREPSGGQGGESGPWAALPDWVGTVIGALCLVAVVGAVGVLVWHVMRDRLRVRSAPIAAPEKRVTPAPANADEVVAALDAGLTDLSDADTDPRIAVIACWVRLEEAAAAVGTPRHLGDTSTDLVRRLLAAHRVSGPVLDDLAGVYRMARYATHTIDERTRADAIRALALLRGELTAGAGVP